MNLKKKIVLAFPYHRLSGVPILFSRLAQELTKIDQEVVLVDYKDGALNMLTANLDVKRVFFVDGHHLEFKEDQIVVMQASNLEYIRPEYTFHPKTTLLFWHLHPDNLKLRKIKVLRSLSDFKGFRQEQFKKLKKFVNLIHEKNGLISMDKTNIQETNRYHNTNLEVPICPILTGENAVGKRPSIDIKRWAYFGRVEGFKTNAIRKLIFSISEYNAKSDACIELFIIGDGDDLGEILKEARSLKVKTTSLGVVGNNKISTVLTNYNISTVAAMGTSILDSMKAGCAVIKLNYFQFETSLYPDYKLKIDEPDDCLARELSTNEMKAASVLPDLVRRIETDYFKIIAKQEQYLLENFDDARNTKKFLHCVSQCKLTASDVSQFLKRSYIRKFYHLIKYGIYK